MKSVKPSGNDFGRMVGAVSIAVAICVFSIGIASATDTNAPPPATSISSSTNAPAKHAGNVSEPLKKPTGVELYAIHCNRCHPERYPTEFSEGEWRTIMIHMRVRANLSADDARAIMQYLREEGGN